jgi:hypothetical protein
MDSPHPPIRKAWLPQLDCNRSLGPRSRQEAGKWQAAKESADKLRIGESEAGELWWQAMQWARQVSSNV